MINDSIEFNTELSEQYEDLRLFAIDKQTIQAQQGYMWFVCKGMLSWLVEKSTNKVDVQPIQMKGKDLQLLHQPQIMQTIADILLKKIKVRNQWSR